MLEILSLFTAYLFATQPIIRKVKDRFKLNRLQESDLLSVGVLVGLSHPWTGDRNDFRYSTLCWS